MLELRRSCQNKLNFFWGILSHFSYFWTYGALANDGSIGIVVVYYSTYNNIISVS